MPEGLPDAIQLILPTRTVFVRVGRKVLESLLESLGWGEEEVQEAALVVSELIQNAIEHGSRGDGSEKTTVRVQPGPEGLDLEVVDPGTGIGPDRLFEQDVTAPVPWDASRGRGLFLVNQLASRFERERDAGGGCRVRVRLEYANP